MTKKVEIKEYKHKQDDQKPKPRKVAASEENARTGHIAHLHRRPCEGSAVFETWARH
ncbi:hypothetical protein [Martelella mediterranea]|uniref:Uncharacterized protein n=1 Tax=Martelella mediterranea DSM 17316 TaxID=1122214 RepID=A0A1U9Z6S5_9HYPH|nr:hypothetical protein [Martelella mediterranea]AQZ53366.1 hypothetical protein Mame_04066 [Martelella mediterranea DSM 17316]